MEFGKSKHLVHNHFFLGRTPARPDSSLLPPPQYESYAVASAGDVCSQSAESASASFATDSSSLICTLSQKSQSASVDGFAATNYHSLALTVNGSAFLQSPQLILCHSGLHACRHLAHSASADIALEALSHGELSAEACLHASRSHLSLRRTFKQTQGDYRVSMKRRVLIGDTKECELQLGVAGGSNSAAPSLDVDVDLDMKHQREENDDRKSLFRIRSKLNDRRNSFVEIHGTHAKLRGEIDHQRLIGLAVEWPKEILKLTWSPREISVNASIPEGSCSPMVRRQSRSQQSL